MSKLFACTLITLLIGVFSLSSMAQVQGVSPTATPAHVLFHDDFLTRADRWQVIDLGVKAAISYTAAGLLLRGSQPHYAVWTVPDNALRLARFDIETEVVLSAGDATARAGLIIDYRSESDLVVLAVSRDSQDAHDGKAYFGNYLFGLWKDILPPVHISLNPGQPIVLDARVDAAHNLRFMVNGQLAIQSKIRDFTAGNFGLFALTGKHGGVQALFHRYVVDDIS